MVSADSDDDDDDDKTFVTIRNNCEQRPLFACFGCFRVVFARPKSLQDIASSSLPLITVSGFNVCVMDSKNWSNNDFSFQFLESSTDKKN